MSKYLRMKFTGNALLTPDYPDNLSPVDGPLYALLPGARRRRKSVFSGQQIDAQFAFVVFPYRQLVRVADNDRDADYKYPDEASTETGVCFFESEEVRIETPSESGKYLTFVDGDTSGFPTLNSKETKWIARWRDFSFNRGALNPNTLNGPGNYVRVIVPGGEVSAGFSFPQIAKIDFDYRTGTLPFPYAQEIVITLKYPDNTPNVTLSSNPFADPTDQSFLTFIWGGKPSIDLTFGNGSMTSLQNLLALPNPVAGHDHQGDYDVEFQILYDILTCEFDDHGRQPLPHIRSTEISKIPCIATTVPKPGGGGTLARALSSSQDDTTQSSVWKRRTLPAQGRQRR